MSKPLRQVFTSSFTTANAPGTEIFDVFSNLKRFKRFTVLAEIAGATGGAMNIYLQRKIATNKWIDWVAFTQVAAAGTGVECVDFASSDLTVSAPGVGTDATPSVALAAGTFTGGHPGDDVRVIAVTGAGATVGAAQIVTMACWADAY